MLGSESRFDAHGFSLKGRCLLQSGIIPLQILDLTTSLERDLDGLLLQLLHQDILHESALRVCKSLYLRPLGEECEDGVIRGFLNYSHSLRWDDLLGRHFISGPSCPLLVLNPLSLKPLDLLAESLFLSRLFL